VRLYSCTVFICICGGLSFYLLGVVMVVPRYLFGLNRLLLPLNEWIVWYSGVPIMFGFVLALPIFSCCSPPSDVTWQHRTWISSRTSK